MRQTATIAHNTALADLAAEAQHGFDRGGHMGSLQAMRALQLQRLANGTQSAFDVAGTEAQMGQDSSAIAHLQQAYDTHDPEMTSIRSSMMLRPLHRDSAFRAMVSKIGLPPLALGQ
jgi:hypothetical protein